MTRTYKQCYPNGDKCQTHVLTRSMSGYVLYTSIRHGMLRVGPSTSHALSSVRVLILDSVKSLDVFTK